MITIEKKVFDDKKQQYEFINRGIKALLKDETDWLANLSNVTAFLNEVLSDINWVGFYLFREDQLILGPFQGKPACTRIVLGEGVCGTAAKKKQPILVEDVHRFPGHIACDLASRSELVVPFMKGETLLGVIDIDSPFLSRFDEEDKVGIVQMAEIIGEHLQISLDKK
jgi:GAF domain-containing protein